MNPAKRAILKQSTKGDQQVKKRLSFAPSVGTDQELGSGTEAESESVDIESPLSTKKVENILPKNLQKTFDESDKEAQAQTGSNSPVMKRSRRSLGHLQSAESSTMAAVEESMMFCSNIRKTTWGLCYVPKTRTRKVAAQGTMTFKVPVVAFKDNTRTEFVNAMNLRKNTKLKILIVGDKADGDGIRISLEEVATSLNMTTEIALSNNPVEEDIIGTHFYIFLYPLDKSTCPKHLSTLIQKIEKITACVNLNSCILLLPSEPRISYDTISPKDLTMLLEQYQMISYSWPREISRAEIFCGKLLSVAECVSGSTTSRSSSLLNWGLQRNNLVGGEDQ